MIRVILADDHAVVRDGLRVLLEAQSDLEVVGAAANGRQAVMRRIYPSRADSVGVRVFSVGGSGRVENIEGWQMMPSNPY